MKKQIIEPQINMWMKRCVTVSVKMRIEAKYHKTENPDFQRD
jgi:hypothetical protein